MESSVPESIIPAISKSMDEDLFPEILKRLPVKSLCRFRCVSKWWNSLISSPYLINLHHSSTSSTIPANLKPYLRRNQKDIYFICRPQEEHAGRQLRFPFQFLRRRTRDGSWNYFNFVDVIKGLVCISYKSNWYSCSMIIWNPAIHKYLPLPRPPFPSSQILDLDLKCKAHFYNYAIGFGFDSCKDDFKVVWIWIPWYNCVGCECRSLVPAYCVYSARKASWRVSIAETLKSYHIYDTSGCFVNGAVHWIVKEFNHFGKHFVLMFDCESEEFRTMELPHIHKDDMKNLLDYGGMLSLMVASVGRIQLWVMEEHGWINNAKK